MSIHDCPSCQCLTPEQRAEREAERRRKEDQVQREERDRQFIQRHGVLTDADLEWARSYLSARRA